LAHIKNSYLVFVCGNGPVVNDGFSTLLGVATTLGKPIVYWKDDARHLWGFNDNPMTIGNLPNVNSYLLQPPNMTIRLSGYQRGGCGPDVFPTLISNAIKDMDANAGTPSQHIQNYMALGDLINNAFSGTPSDGITYANCWTSPDNIQKSFQKLINIVIQGSGADYLSSEDKTYLQSSPPNTNGPTPPFGHNIKTFFSLSNTPVVPLSGMYHPPFQPGVVDALKQTKLNL